MSSGVLQNNKSNLQAFWKPLLGSCAITVVIFALLNFVVNPYGIYPPALLPTISDSIYEYKINLLSEFDPPPEALVLGSSRVQCIDPDIVGDITGKRCFNWALWECRTEILYASIRIALEEFEAPVDLVIVGVEPEMFHLTNDLHAQARTSNAYTKYFETVPVYKPILDKAIRSISYGQLLASLQSVSRVMKGVATAENPNWRDDGFRIFPTEGRGGTEEIIENFESAIESGILTYPENYWKPDEFLDLSDRRIEYWNMFLDICVENEIQVIAYMQPAHPELLRVLYELGGEPIYEETAELLEDTIDEIHGTWRDYRYIESFGGDPSAFWDEAHMLPSNGDLLIRDFLSDFDSQGDSGQD